MMEMTQEEAWNILRPFFTNPVTGEVDREATRRIMSAQKEQDDAVKEVEGILFGGI